MERTVEGDLGDPRERCPQQWEHKRRVGMHNRATCPGRESDRLVVARKRVTTAEQRGLSVDMSRSEEGRTDWRKNLLRSNWGASYR